MPAAHVQALAEKMIEALKDQPIENRADRIKSYWDAGVSLAFISDADWSEADEIARTHELNRRVSQ